MANISTRVFEVEILVTDAGAPPVEIPEFNVDVEAPLNVDADIEVVGPGSEFDVEAPLQLDADVDAMGTDWWAGADIEAPIEIAGDVEVVDNEW